MRVATSFAEIGEDYPFYRRLKALARPGHGSVRSVPWFHHFAQQRRYPGFEESACEPIARADTSISRRYLFSLADWIIGLPQAGRPSGGLATFTIEKGIQT
jgi:hypothetical protein